MFCCDVSYDLDDVDNSSGGANSVYDSMLALVQEDGPTSMYSLEVSSFMSFIVSYKKLNFQGYLLSVYI